MSELDAIYALHDQAIADRDALLELNAELLNELHHVADYLADIATQDQCTAGNFDGGNAWNCEHCQMIEWMNRINGLIAKAGQP